MLRDGRRCRASRLRSTHATSSFEGCPAARPPGGSRDKGWGHTGPGMTEVTELRDFLAKEDEAASAQFQSVMTTEQQESVVVSRSDEHWAADVRAVLNTVESERSVLLREADGGP